MTLTKSLARRILATSPVIVGAALLALFSFTPSSAMADATLTLYHDFVGNNDILGNPADPSFNPFNSSHTVVAQYSGVCIEDPSVEPPDQDPAEGVACLADADCGDADEICDLSGISGVEVGFQVTGINGQETAFGPTDGSGQASFTYPDTNGPGQDLIQACADLGEGSGVDDGDVAECLSDSTGGGADPLGEDVASNELTKNWLPTVIINPPGAFNLPGGSHTVTATLNGVAGFCNGGTPTACTSDLGCVADGVCDFSGYLLGIKVTLGPNLGGTGTDTGLVSTNAKGQVTLTYNDAGGPGTDSIQACADLGDDTDLTVGACLIDAAAGGGDSPFDDIESAVASKSWSAVNVALTPLEAFNPIGVPHVVTATAVGIAKHCTNDFTQTCTLNSECTSNVCDLSGYPVFFADTGTCVGGNNGGATCLSGTDCNSGVCVGGPNLGQQTTGVTNGSGAATGTFNSILEGNDTIQSCVDGDATSFGVSDDTGLIECINDFAEGDIPSNTVIKHWFANFVTGGAGVSVTVDKKKNLQFSGIIGKAGQTGIQGQWNAVSMVSGKTVSCHFDSFTSLVFSGPPATNPVSTHNTAMFTTGPGKCNDGSTPVLTATMVDTGEGKKVPRDTINVSGDARFTTGGTKSLATGNLQVHSIIP